MQRDQFVRPEPSRKAPSMPARVRVTEQLDNKTIARLLKVVPTLVKLPKGRTWIDYDDEADVLYLSFRRPQRATDSEMREDGVIVHRRGKAVVGLTVLEASKR